MENDNITVSISERAVIEIKDAIEHLQGEEAVEEIIRFVDFPNDGVTGDAALKAVVRFYSNVRYLQEIIKTALKAN